MTRSDFHQHAYVTVEQVARYLNISQRTVRRMVQRDELRAIYVGKQLRTSSEELVRFE